MQSAWVRLLENTLRNQAYFSHAGVSPHATCNVSEYGNFFHVWAALSNPDESTPAAAIFVIPSTIPEGGLSRWSAVWTPAINAYWVLDNGFRKWNQSGRPDLTPQPLLPHPVPHLQPINNSQHHRWLSGDTLWEPTVGEKGEIQQELSKPRCSADAGGKGEASNRLSIKAEQSKALFDVVKSLPDSASSPGESPTSTTSMRGVIYQAPEVGYRDLIVKPRHLLGLDLATVEDSRAAVVVPDHLDLALNAAQQEELVELVKAVERGRLATVSETLAEARAVNATEKREVQFLYVRKIGQSKSLDGQVRDLSSAVASPNVFLPKETTSTQTSSPSSTVAESSGGISQTESIEKELKAKKLRKNQLKRQRMARKKEAMKLRAEEESKRNCAASSSSVTDLSASIPDSRAEESGQGQSEALESILPEGGAQTTNASRAAIDGRRGSSEITAPSIESPGTGRNTITDDGPSTTSETSEANQASTTLEASTGRSKNFKKNQAKRERKARKREAERTAALELSAVDDTKSQSSMNHAGPKQEDNPTATAHKQSGDLQASCQAEKPVKTEPVPQEPSKSSMIDTTSCSPRETNQGGGDDLLDTSSRSSDVSFLHVDVEGDPTMHIAKAQCEPAKADDAPLPMISERLEITYGKMPERWEDLEDEDLSTYAHEQDGAYSTHGNFTLFHHMYLTMQHLRPYFFAQIRILQEADRSLDWFRSHSHQMQELAQADELDGQEDFMPDMPTHSALSTSADVMGFHHLNFLFQAVDKKSATPPEVSLWAAITCKEILDNQWPPAFSTKAVLIAQAWQYVDPWSYSGPEELLSLQGTKLRDAVVGLVEKVYIPYGRWMQDWYDDHENLPLYPEEVQTWTHYGRDDRYSHVRRYAFAQGEYTAPYVAAYVKEKAVIKPLAGQSKLRQVQDVEELDSDVELEHDAQENDMDSLCGSSIEGSPRKANLRKDEWRSEHMESPEKLRNRFLGAENIPGFRPPIDEENYPDSEAPTEFELERDLEREASYFFDDPRTSEVEVESGEPEKLHEVVCTGEIENVDDVGAYVHVEMRIEQEAPQVAQPEGDDIGVTGPWPAPIIALYELSNVDRPTDPTSPQNRPSNVVPLSHIGKHGMDWPNAIEEVVVEATSPYEFVDEDRPLDMTLPQNRQTAVEHPLRFDVHESRDSAVPDAGDDRANEVLPVSDLHQRPLERIPAYIAPVDASTIELTDKEDSDNSALEQSVEQPSTPDTSNSDGSQEQAKEDLDFIEDYIQVSEGSTPPEDLQMVLYDPVPRWYKVMVCTARILKRAAKTFYKHKPATNASFHRDYDLDESSNAEHQEAHFESTLLWATKKGIKATVVTSLLPIHAGVWVAKAPYRAVKKTWKAGKWTCSWLGAKK